MVVNPLLFPPPRSTRNWPSRAVLGERVWAARDTADIPEQFRSTSAANASYAFQLVGVAALAYGLVVLDPITTVTGLVLVQCAKVWFLDRMVLLFADVVPRDPKYASWDY